MAAAPTSPSATTKSGTKTSASPTPKGAPAKSVAGAALTDASSVEPAKRPGETAFSSFIQKLLAPTKGPALPDVIDDEEKAMAQHIKLINRLTVQAFGIAAASILFVLALPFFQTRYHYFGVAPDQKVSTLIPLMMPNMTDGAIRSWAASSVTEVMTFGFGDMDAKLVMQKRRFTREGWADFVHTFLDKKIGAQFRKSQLVLTTVPSADPVISSQGINLTHIYEWEVKIPIIMTYATNNNVTKPEKGSITLTIVRVPYDENSGGIAIQSWYQREAR